MTGGASSHARLIMVGVSARQTGRNKLLGGSRASSRAGAVVACVIVSLAAPRSNGFPARAPLGTLVPGSLTPMIIRLLLAAKTRRGRRSVVGCSTVSLSAPRRNTLLLTVSASVGRLTGRGRGLGATNSRMSRNTWLLVSNGRTLLRSCGGSVLHRSSTRVKGRQNLSFGSAVGSIMKWIK
ncbi:hypothetical protein B0H63DRAFT_470252 [Podospora didyma]|uniref:Uncharacterized protein n=1 Tax=Podospora didyma TaxID=330526 RepID=A0AAE0U1K7_9PEZI|nr:hypothetical protein B0H63DRAFT_470252 [Podospora didyma]